MQRFGYIRFFSVPLAKKATRRGSLVDLCKCVWVDLAGLSSSTCSKKKKDRQHHVACTKDDPKPQQHTQQNASYPPAHADNTSKTTHPTPNKHANLSPLHNSSCTTDPYEHIFPIYMTYALSRIINTMLRILYRETIIRRSMKTTYKPLHNTFAIRSNDS